METYHCNKCGKELQKIDPAQNNNEPPGSGCCGLSVEMFYEPENEKEKYVKYICNNEECPNYEMFIDPNQIIVDIA